MSIVDGGLNGGIVPVGLSIDRFGFELASQQPVLYGAVILALLGIVTFLVYVVGSGRLGLGLGPVDGAGTGGTPRFALSRWGWMMRALLLDYRAIRTHRTQYPDEYTGFFDREDDDSRPE